MKEFWTAAVTLLAGIFALVGLARWRRTRQERRAALRPGDIVFVRTPDRKRLIARVISRGASHFWIELAPGDARWWVPAASVEPVSPVVSERMEADERISHITARRASAARRGGREWA
jgi:hypothetical protein